jgi:hypothetical protein
MKGRVFIYGLVVLRLDVLAYEGERRRGGGRR